MDIKTRDSLMTIKTFDRLQNLAVKTKNGAEEARQGISDSFESNDYSETEYAGNQLEAYESKTAYLAAHTADKIGRWGVRETANNIRKWKNKPQKLRVSKQKRLPNPKRKALPKAAKTTQKTAKASAKTAKTSAKAAKATAKAGERIAKAAKAAWQGMVKLAKLVGKAMVAAGKAIVAAGKAIVAAIAAGGWIAVLVILIIVVIVAAVMVVCSIFMPDENGVSSANNMALTSQNKYTLMENEIIQTVPHDYLEIHDNSSMKDILAVYSVIHTTGDQAFETDNNSQTVFEQIFDVMFSLSHYTTEQQETVTREYIDENGEPFIIEEVVTRVVLHIERSNMTANEAADHFGFDSRQRECLDTLMGQDFEEMWAALVK